MSEERITCETPTPGKEPTRIAKWKYDLVRAAILKVLDGQEEGVPFQELPTGVAACISEEDRARLGSVSWYVTTVKLDLECRGEILRMEESRPQRLKLA
ncbi:MAG: DUF6958 family protein [Planctomycetota bacterium]